MKLLRYCIRGRGKYPSSCHLRACIFVVKAESIDDGTESGSLRRAVIGEPDEGSPHGLQGRDFFIESRDPSARQILRRCAVAGIESKKGRDLVKREARSLRRADRLQAAKIAARIAPWPLMPRRLRQQSASLIIADRLDVDPACAGKFTNFHFYP